MLLNSKSRQGRRRPISETWKPCILATREEPGCLEYTAFWNKDERVLTLFECFADSDAAAKHLEYPHYAVDFRALKKYYDGKAEAQRYEDPII
ncbi:MAG: putative quinol monooxygenase [Oscillospiraceae bacterium]